MKPKHFFWVILILAILFRFFRLGIVPFGYNWDETSIIYNAWGIALWHRDEWARLMPLAFRSFGDYKAPLMFYLLAVPFKFFGVITPLIRIYSALAGVGTVVVSYFLVRLINQKSHPNWPLLTMTLVAFSPWAINFSRVGFEANLALFLVALGVYFLLLGIQKPKAWFLSAASLSLSMYAYHAAKITVPLLVIFFLVTHFNLLKTRLKRLIWPALIGLTITLPLLYNTFLGGGFERGMTLILFNDNHSFQSLTGIWAELLTNLSQQFSPDFLVGGRDAVGLRHLTPGFGIMYLVELPFAVYGLYLLVRQSKDENRISANSAFVLWWAIAGLAPAILSHQTPHAVRSLLFMPALQLIIGLGIFRFWTTLKGHNSKLKFAAVILPVILYLGQFGLYLSTYYTSYAIASASQFQYGYREALLVARELGRTRDKIVVTDRLGQPYVYVLLTNQINPEQFLAGALANYEFHTFGWPYYKPNSVIVGTPQEIPPHDAAVKHLVTIPGTDQVVLVVAVTPP